MTKKTEALPAWKQFRIEPTPPKYYACSEAGNSLGYIVANDADEAAYLAGLRWGVERLIKIEQYDGVL